MQKLVASAAVLLTAVGSVTIAQELRDLRGTPVDAPSVVNMNLQWEGKEGRMVRNYRQQPPLIPHSTTQYQIDLRTNQCVSCHDWTKAGERNAPTLSMTHYLDRDGIELDHIAGTRWFCNQCHVPQADTPNLVENTFQPSIGD